jgi:hypothetical protein
MPESNLPNALLKIGLALAKQLIKNAIGGNLVETFAVSVAEASGEQVQAKIDSIFASKEGKKESLKAAKSADERFKEKCKDNNLRDLFTMEYGDLPSVQTAIAGLPEAIDEEVLKETLFKAFRGDSPKSITDNQIHDGVKLYIECLHSALAPVKEQTLTIIVRSVLKIEGTTQRIEGATQEINEKLDFLIGNVANDKKSIKSSKKIRQQVIVKRDYDEEIPSTDTIIKEGNFLQIVVSQMFRLADLLTYPEGVKAKKFYEIITDSNKYRRFINRKSGFELKPYGTLKSVITIDEQFDTFWKPAIPDFRKEIDPLRFIPFELDLSDHLRTLKPDPGSVLESVLQGNLKLIKNIQINGWLRIYPPGTGIISMKLTLEFAEGIHVEISGELARNIESLLFVDPNKVGDLGKPSESIFLEIIDKVAETFFKDEMFIGAERRWQPPETMYNFRDFHGNGLEEKIRILARLMSYAPANHEDLDVLERRIIKSLNHSHWQEDKVFSAVGEGVALVVIPLSDAAGKKESQKRLMEFFINTRELITAAEYSVNSFAERLNQLNSEYQNDEIENAEIFDLLSTMQHVLFAVSSIREHLHKLNKGELMTFAKDLWNFNNPVNFGVLHENLNYLQDVSLSRKSKASQAKDIRDVIDKIKQLPSPFPFNKKQNLFKA